MVNHSASLDSVFGALSDPTRREILVRLAKQPLTISDLASPFAMSLPAASKHIRVLERAGLLRVKKVGRVQHCEIVPDAMTEVKSWIRDVELFWNERLDALGEFLESQPKEEE